MLITLGMVGYGHRGAGPEIVVHDAALTKQDRARVEAYWTGTGIADVAHEDAIGDPVQPEWTEGGLIARTVGRL
ncbi:hypothetical protein ACWD3Z_47115 [Streptomyces sp. NPDC002740]